MVTTKTRSIKTKADLIDHFDIESQKKGETFNSRIVHLMKKDSKFKEKK